MANLKQTTTFFSTNGYNATTLIIIVCSALALYNALELLLLIFTTFRAFRGLYFWSLLFASFGIIPYVIGFLIEYFQLTSQVAGLVITIPGWVFLVTGQSVVLYSRLGIVLGKGHTRLLKAVKYMIIVDGIVFHVTTTVVDFGAYLAPSSTHFPTAYKYIEKIQMTGFTVQEFILSGLYVWKTADILKGMHETRRTHRIMWQLFSINVLIIGMDIGLLVFEYKDDHVLEQTLKGVIYSVKLKLEFAILSKLITLTSNNGTAPTMIGDTNDFLDTSRTVSDATRAHSAVARHRGSHLYAKEDAEKTQTFHVELVKTSQETDMERMDHDESCFNEHDLGRQMTSGSSDDLYAQAIRSI